MLTVRTKDISACKSFVLVSLLVIQLNVMLNLTEILKSGGVAHDTLYVSCVQLHAFDSCLP